MMMVRVTVFLLLALVSSVMLTQTMATRNESAVYDDLSTSAAVPTCQADYAKMDIKQPKLLVNYPGLAMLTVFAPIQRMETLLSPTGSHAPSSTCSTAVDGSRGG